MCISVLTSLKPVLKTTPAPMTGASQSPDSTWELGTLGFYPSLQVAGSTLGASSRGPWRTQNSRANFFSRCLGC